MTIPNTINYIKPKNMPSTLKEINSLHLIITGSKGAGKSTSVSILADELCCNGLRTYAIRDSGYAPVHIILKDYFNDNIFAIAANKNSSDTGVDINISAFTGLGAELLEKAIASDKEWIIIDEIGFLDTHSTEYCNLIRKAFSTKRVIAVVAKRDVAFLHELLKTPNAVVIDLDKEE